jgi:arsenate reductase
MNKASVLFLCTDNSTRSQMAEALLREMSGDCYEAYSAGLASQALSPVAAQVMAEIGIDISEQRAKGVDELLGRINFGYFVTVCEQARATCPTFPGVAIRLHWPVDDPAAVAGSEGDRLAAFRRVRDELADRIAEFVRQNCTEFGPSGRRFCGAEYLA